MQHRQRAPGYATLICMARQRVARRAPGGPPKAEPGADAGPAAPQGAALLHVNCTEGGNGREAARPRFGDYGPDLRF